MVRCVARSGCNARSWLCLVAVALHTVRMTCYNRIQHKVGATLACFGLMTHISGSVKGCGGEAVLDCAQMMEVWGAGDSTARRWQQEGCHSLQDVQARSDLTTQQVSRAPRSSPAQLRICCALQPCINEE